MSGRTWIILDVSNLAYRAFHSTGGLRHDGMATGTVFGVMRTMAALRGELGSTDMAFAFDVGRGVREAEFSYYKENRRKKRLADGEDSAVDDMRRQIDRMRTEYLPALGYKNLLFRMGYEADDLIASAVTNMPAHHRAIIVSSDKDLYQLLNGRVAIYNPTRKALYTAKMFKTEYGVRPTDWPAVKAIAGDDGDDVPGAPRVGIATAAKWVRYLLYDGPFNPDTAAGVVASFWTASKQYKDNLKLVTLPYPGTPPVVLKPDDEPDPAAWRKLADRLGMTSILDAMDGERVARKPVGK